jgi:hypothetical protein
VERDRSGFEFGVAEANTLSGEERAELLRVFEANYSRANPAYLDRAFQGLRYVARAYQGGVLAGFALGETRLMDLPRLPAQVVSLAGICCVAPEFRRRGLFGRLEFVALTAGEVPEPPRRLGCGRFAHPAGMRVMSRNPTVVPKPGIAPTAWQREVGEAIAEAYRVHAFDSETFVCVGSGEPIGYPNIEFEVEPHEWEVFKPVDRDRGDALLAMVWGPDAPPGW